MLAFSCTSNNMLAPYAETSQQHIVSGSSLYRKGCPIKSSPFLRHRKNFEVERTNGQLSRMGTPNLET